MRPYHFCSIRTGLKSLIRIGTVLIAFGITTAARAQFEMPQVPGFSSNYPWFNDVPEYQQDQSFQWFLAYHPGIARALSYDPGLLYNAGWRSQFPALQEYLADHPDAWQELNGRNWAEGPAETSWGDYDEQHQWRDAYWWHLNNPNLFYDDHAAWASLDSRWRDQDGAFDAQRRWHYGEWWYNQDPSWVASNHPNWLSEHRNWENQSEQHNYRQQHAMIQADQRQQANQQSRQHAVDQRQANLQQQQTIREDNQRRQEQVNQQNQQRVVDQRQANLQQQQTIRQDNQRQQQVNQQNQREQQDRQNQHQEASREQQQATHQQAPEARHNEQQSQSRREGAPSRQPQSDAGHQAGNDQQKH